MKAKKLSVQGYKNKKEEILNIVAIAGILNNKRIIEITMICDSSLAEVCEDEIDLLLESFRIKEGVN
ncbi:MAG: hypothetical protein GF347_00465 [Candidatus Moranbacteria bacterium]|nr:hypothetical protein [Candidatus Moranbacteria bacterium]